MNGSNLQSSLGKVRPVRLRQLEVESCVSVCFGACLTRASGHSRGRGCALATRLMWRIRPPPSRLSCPSLKNPVPSRRRRTCRRPGPSHIEDIVSGKRHNTLNGRGARACVSLPADGVEQWRSGLSSGLTSRPDGYAEANVAKEARKPKCLAVLSGSTTAFLGL